MVDVAQLVESRLVVPVVAGSSPVIHPVSSSSVPERRWWWPAATAIAVTAVNAALAMLEIFLFAGKMAPETGIVWVVLVAHPIAGFVCVALFSLVALARGGGGGGSSGIVGYSERYLRGLAYGIITSIVISVTVAIVGSGWRFETISNAGAILSLSVVTLQLPLACVVGGLTWQLLSKRRGAPAPTTRPRRPIEDAE